MIKYGDVELRVVVNSMQITPKKEQIIRHFPGTDKSSVMPLGRPSTTVTCTLLALTASERLMYEQILHDDAEAELVIDDRLYKRVVTEPGNTKPVSVDLGVNWHIDATFIALDPIPYSVATGGALY